MRQVPRRGLPSWVSVPRPVWRWSLAAAALVVVLTAGWLLWPDDEPPPRQREYRAETACLLTGAQGVGSPEASPVWSGMQEASLATQVKVQFLEVDGPQTGAQAETFLAGLVQNRCDVIFAVGAAPVAGVSKIAARYPQARFVAFGATAPSRNVSVVETNDPEETRRQAHDLVVALTQTPS
ncbi:hypothetical protein E0H26_06320 [Micromonospora zingiberis]|uniref:BMP family ABC transporter substrate-binding protein n=1 Tax=Micromonospora zingiberis TaxID=2053011 RepID=A0A4R0GQ09_9ACTN|nr:hypothetical protein [Micromonospora zingiberis]TCB99017.1 hypothetical protein E0H26_06320 [Micromonospora zingiberis]